MLIKKLQLQRFGCLNDFTAEFQPGLNIIRGPNESGKSTLHQALLMVLLALPNQNKKNSFWQAWGNDQWYWLQLIFADMKGKEYQITKDFQTGVQELSLPNGRTSTSRDLIESTMEEHLGTNSLLMMRSTLCVEQDALADISSGRTEISHSLETVVTGGEDDVYTEKALKRLDKRMREFRVGFKRIAARPGPLALARDRRAELTEKVGRYRVAVQDYEADERTLEEAQSRLAVIDHELGPLSTTLADASRLHQVQEEFTKWKGLEDVLDERITNVETAQQEIKDAEKGLLTLGAVAQMSVEEKSTFDQLLSRARTIQEEYGKYKEAVEAYKEKLAAYETQQEIYKGRYAQYEIELIAFNQAEKLYKADVVAYNAAVTKFRHELAAYQEARKPYEEALEKQREESKSFETQMLTYTQAVNAYKIELETYNTVKAEQDQQTAVYEKVYADYELNLEAYDQQLRRSLEKLPIAPVEGPVVSSEQSAIAPAWLVLIILGGLTVIIGIVLMVLPAGSGPAGIVGLGLGAILIVVGIWRRSRSTSAIKVPDTAQIDQTIYEETKPPVPEQPKPPQRPRLETLVQPVPPEPPHSISSTGEELWPPATEKPQPPAIEQPQQPSLIRPEAPDPLPPPPIKPQFDQSRWLETKTEIEAMLAAAGCSKIAELNDRYQEAVKLRAQNQKSSSRLVGLLGDDKLEDLKNQRTAASKNRRDAKEILDEPGLQQAARMTVLEVNQLASEIKKLEDEQAALLVKRQQLGFKIEQGPVSAEDLLQAEEALEDATAAYERAQDRTEVWQLTYDMLVKARGRTLKQAQASLGPKTANYLRRLTDGRYQETWIDSNLQIELEDPAYPDRRVEPESLSRGAQDQLYMSARLALVDLLFPNTRPPILLDDPFVHFDPERLAAAIDMCNDVAAERQILLFTCSENYNQVGHHILMPPLQQLET